MLLGEGLFDWRFHKGHSAHRQPQPSCLSLQRCACPVSQTEGNPMLANSTSRCSNSTISNSSPHPWRWVRQKAIGERQCLPSWPGPIGPSPASWGCCLHPLVSIPYAGQEAYHPLKKSGPRCSWQDREGDLIILIRKTMDIRVRQTQVHISPLTPTS